MRRVSGRAERAAVARTAAWVAVARTAVRPAVARAAVLAAARAAVLTVVLAAVLATAGCVSPAWDDHDYALKAAASAETAASGTELVRLAVQRQDELFTPYLKTVLTESARELGSVNDQFGGVQPPSDASDRVREELMGLTTRAEDEVDALLVQVRRGGVKDPARAAAELRDLAARLRRFGEEHRS
ncbi:hypothetical protein AB0D67_24795 [Streptosporangium sp. NPDC048047]|uniref:hypothetical protein n=1 Tax=Streptosporangium sp. NPDC048047 TaxID=3155748 RepID=UPI003422FB73